MADVLRQLAEAWVSKPLRCSLPHFQGHGVKPCKGEKGMSKSDRRVKRTPALTVLTTQ